MRLAVVPASDLTRDQLAAIGARIAAPEHCHDHGAVLFWGRDGALARCYVGVLAGSGLPVGLAYVDGSPAHVRAAWWLDSRARGQGLGSEMIDALAATLKMSGCSGVARIPVDSYRGEYDAASSALVRRLQSHFA